MFEKRHATPTIGDIETRKRIAEWMRKELGPAWRVLSVACYSVSQTNTRWVAIACNDNSGEVREGLFSYNSYGALCYHQPTYRVNGDGV